MVSGLMMLMLADSLLVTHRRPSGARAILRGAVPTVSSASLPLVTASNAVTESLS